MHTPLNALVRSIGIDPRQNLLLQSTIFDTAATPLATGEVLFFPGLAGRNNSKWLTNLDGANQFPAPDKFLVSSIGIILGANGAAADVAKILDNSLVEFEIAGKTQFSAPLAALACQSGGAIGDKVDQFKRLEFPLMIPSGVSFRGRIYLGTAPVAAVNMIYVLDGVKITPAPAVVPSAQR